MNTVTKNRLIKTDDMMQNALMKCWEVLDKAISRANYDYYEFEEIQERVKRLEDLREKLWETFYNFHIQKPSLHKKLTEMVLSSKQDS